MRQTTIFITIILFSLNIFGQEFPLFYGKTLDSTFSKTDTIDIWGQNFWRANEARAKKYGVYIKSLKICTQNDYSYDGDSVTTIIDTDSSITFAVNVMGNNGIFYYFLDFSVDSFATLNLKFEGVGMPGQIDTRVCNIICLTKIKGQNYRNIEAVSIYDNLHKRRIISKLKK